MTLFFYFTKSIIKVSLFPFNDNKGNRIQSFPFTVDGQELFIIAAIFFRNKVDIKSCLSHSEGANQPQRGILTTVTNTFNYRYKHF